jgi:dTDP-4-amino-4,6-dideoxygalactose transaminase
VIKIPPFDVTKQFELIGQELTQTVSAVLASGNYVGGENVTQFEAEFAKYIGTDFGVACNSGTDALYLALRALSIGAGDEVITTPFTFFSSSEAIDMVGAKPVFVDIEADTFNLDLALVEQAITPRTRAILPVHLFGRPVDMTQLMAIAKKHNLYVIEDCAQSTGATWADQKVGSIGDIGCFSYYPTKNLGCCGDGGLATTNDGAIAAKIRILREHGSPQRYFHDYIGMNSRLDAIQAAILRVKLPYLDKWNFLRRAIADRYHQALEQVEGLVLPASSEDSVWNQYTIRICQSDRNLVQAKLKELGVISMIYYPLPLHLQKVYADLNHRRGSFPISEMVSDQVLSLPMFPELSEAQQNRVVEALKQCLG